MDKQTIFFKQQRNTIYKLWPNNEENYIWHVHSFGESSSALFGYFFKILQKKDKDDSILNNIFDFVGSSKYDIAIAQVCKKWSVVWWCLLKLSISVMLEDCCFTLCLQISFNCEGFVAFYLNLALSTNVSSRSRMYWWVCF